MLTRHYKYTDSSVAFTLLKNFKITLKNFKLVIPIDYKKALINIENKDSENIRMKG